MPEWATFVGVSSVVTLLLLALSHATETAFSDPAAPASGATDSSAADANVRDEFSPRSRGPTDDGETTDPLESDPDAAATADPDAVPGREPGSAPWTRGEGPQNQRAQDEIAEDEAVHDGSSSGPGSGPYPNERASSDENPGSPASRTLSDPMSTGALLANVALSQGTFAVLLVGTAVYAAIPPDALGIAFTREYLVSGLGIGAAFGLVLYVANELGSLTATRLGFEHDEALRAMLAPDAVSGWLVLLLVVLPIVASFEELLFRGALIGATAAGFDVSPWLLAVVSSVAFALGHGVQGSVGVAVTGLLGFVLAAGFVLTDSLLVVIVAHYLINALEFAVHEGLGVEWTAAEGG